MMQNGDDEQASVLSTKTLKPSPDTLTKLIKRLRALTVKLLPVEVDVKSINDATSRVVTPNVVSAYIAAAGDFGEALPYCLLRARAEFMWDAYSNPADFGENHGRGIACEAIARRVVHQGPSDRLDAIMCTRFKHREPDGDVSELSSALEVAIDSHCTIFLSSSEAQDVVNSLWRGDIIQRNNENNEITYFPYHKTRAQGFWNRIDPARISVPRYQNSFRIVVWLIFLVVFSQAVREPLERLNSDHASVDAWEYILYIMALAFCFEDIQRWYKLLRFASYRAIGFWHVIAFITDSLLLAAFVLRVLGLGADADRASELRLTSFQVLSCVSPFICFIELVTIFDGFRYIGTMQICVARMLQESGIFFALLSVLALGFWQGLYALDAADGETENGRVIVHVLVQALLSSPDYAKFALSPVGQLLYYLWNLVTAVILLNVLISLFSSAYSDVVEDAEAEYMTFFAAKTVAMIRAPDSYVYPAPFNLIETFLVAPFEFLPLFSLEAYARLNRFLMSILFFIPLTAIALYETTSVKNTWMGNWLQSADAGEQILSCNVDPEVDGDDAEYGLEISKVPFDDLVKMLPDTQQSSEATILKELKDIQERIDVLSKMLEISRS
ncbi:hypothetical protein SERLA73DRAFT_71198 [Serpula lacrymans var. lacrymans S7.3]|uniref:Calcium activated cation channel n=2 Tax=Serpula lacrymans var. lacrymans TaxID=341189 RepID=F8PPH4_SERL3|nr:uncharacterized protein SERLADRAFT_435440 [Serpula lacrymans var. lacrymans S7.9]EGO02051.1 hypothetical protein SERLA73DRAFT_71198 [Serpula lacrymans var. lacrymans S7.3]EGO27672.1 hypothetical protein SERLADRAFT_435440 [Serpula lacrymans var. lacrymans S7.9]